MGAGPATSPKPPGRMFQLRLPFLMVLVAGSALVIWAWQFHERNQDTRRSFVTIQIRDLAHAKIARDRQYAADSLGDASPDEVGLVLPALAAGTRDADVGVRRAAIGSLSKVIHSALSDEMGRVLPTLVAGTCDADLEVRCAAIGSLAYMIHLAAESREGAVADEIAIVTPLLIAALKDENSRVRYSAAHAFIEMTGKFISPTTRKPPVSYGPDPRRVLPALVEAMKDSEEYVSGEAIEAFCRVAPDATDAPPEMGEFLDRILPREEGTLRSTEAMTAWGSVFFALGRPWRNADALWAPLLRGTDSSDYGQSQQCLSALWRIGPAPASALPALMERLDSKRWGVGEISHLIAARFGPAARTVLPKLLGSAHDEMREAAILEHTNVNALNSTDLIFIRQQIPTVAAILAIDSDSSEARTLVEDLASGDWVGNRKWPIVAGLFGPAARPALPKLLALARDEMGREGEMREFTAVDAILAIDADSPEAQSLLAPLVERALHPRAGDADPPPAVGSLIKFGKSAAPALLALRAALDDRSRDVHARATHALARIEAPAPEDDDSAEPIPPGKP